MVSSEETIKASSPTCILENVGHLCLIQQSFTANYRACVTEKTPPETQNVVVYRQNMGLETLVSAD